MISPRTSRLNERQTHRPLRKQMRKKNKAGGGGRGGRAARGEGTTIAQLRTMLKGAVIAPGDAGYDAARTVFYGGIDRRAGVGLRAGGGAGGLGLLALGWWAGPRV